MQSAIVSCILSVKGFVTVLSANLQTDFEEPAMEKRDDFTG